MSLNAELAFLQLDELCDRFESAWLDGQSPRVEEFLSEVSEKNRSEALRELLKLDAHYRQRGDASPTVEEYRERFPSLGSVWLRGLLQPVMPRGSSNPAGDSFARTTAIGSQTGLPSIPGYEVLELIGRGGMGVVYKARDLSLHRPVAIKMVSAGNLAGPETLSRFRAEARAVASLQHPNLVQIHEVGEHDGRPYLAFEYVSGGGLDLRLRGEPQPPQAAARLIKTIAHAIQYAHSQGIVHRDLKPANILLATPTKPLSNEPRTTMGSSGIASTTGQSLLSEPRPNSSLENATLPGTEPSGIYGHPKISDFGLAKDLESDSEQTKSGAILGTPSYMAPEQAVGRASSISPATDVYALGAILYEMLTGRPPFRAPTVIETLDQVRTLEPLSLRRVQPTVPRDLDTICLKCLQKDPVRRYVSASALADDLDRFLRDEPVLARPVSTTERTWRWCRRHPLVASLIALLFVVTSSGVSGIAWKWREATRQTELAEQNFQLAESNATKFRVERDAVQQQRLIATANAELAKKNQQEAEGAQRVAEAAQRRAELSSYIHRVGQARGELLADQVGRADLLLDDCPSEMRGWEWSYLKLQCHSDLRTLRGHTDKIQSVAYSPDGKTIASGTGGWGLGVPGEVIVWDAETGSIRATLRGHEGPVMGVAFSPDGQKIASSATPWEKVREAYVKVWSVSGELLFTLPAPSANGFGVAFSPDGKQLAVASTDGPIRFWDATSGQQLPLTLNGHKGWVFKVQFSPDGQRLVSAGRDGSVRVWNLATGQQEFAKTGYPDMRRALFSPDGRYIAYTGYGNELWLWDFTSKDKDQEKPVKYLYDVGVISGLSFSPEGRRLAVTSHNGRVLLIETQSGRVLQQFHTHEGMVVAVAFSPDGRVLATGGVDRTVKLSDARTDWDASRIQPGIGDYRGKVGHFKRLAITPDGRRLLLPNSFNYSSPGLGETTLLVWDLEESKIVQTCRGHTGWLNDVSVAPDGSRYATASDDRTARIWNAVTGQEERKLVGHAAEVTSVSFHPDGDRLATAAADGAIRLWDRATGESRRELSGHEGRVTRVTFDTTGKRLASSGQDQTIRVWDVETGQELATLRGHTGGVRAVAFSHNDRWIASASEDDTVRLWDAKNFQPSHVLRGHSGLVSDVAFSIDDRRVGSCGFDITVKLWDLESGAEAIALRESTDNLNCLAFHPDGRRIFTVHGGSVRMWNSHPQPSPKPEAAFDSANQTWHEQEIRNATNVQNYAAALFHAQRLVKLGPLNSTFHTRLADVFSEMGDWPRAQQSFATADLLMPNYFVNIYGIALTQFQLGNLKAYRQSCARMRALLNDKSPAAAIDVVVWFCVIAPDVVSDSPKLVELVQRSLASANDQQRIRMTNTLGAAQYRAGEFESARGSLQESIKRHSAPGNTLLVEDYFFLSMVESRLGHPDEAREWLAKADALLVTQKTKPDGSPNVLPWSFHIVRDMLRLEAQALIDAAISKP